MKNLLKVVLLLLSFSIWAGDKEDIQKLQCEGLKDLANQDIKTVEIKIKEQLNTLVIKNNCEFTVDGDIQFDTVTCVQICTKDKGHGCTEGCLKVDQHYQEIAKNISKAFLEGKKAALKPVEVATAENSVKDEKAELEELKGKEPASAETPVKPELKPEQDPILKEIEKM